MAERVDVSRLSVAECMALGGGGAEPAKEEGLQGKLEKLVQEIGLEVDGVDRHLHTGLEDPERTQPTDPRGVLEEALNKTALATQFCPCHLGSNLSQLDLKCQKVPKNCPYFPSADNGRIRPSLQSVRISDIPTANPANNPA